MALVITPVPPFPGLKDWEKLISFRPSTVTQVAVNARFTSLLPPSPARITHAIENGLGPVSLDYYPVRVSAMPTSGGRTMTAAELLEQVRRNLSTFVNSTPDGCSFTPYDALIDTAAWLPLFLPIGFVGAVMSIDIFSNRINVDDGSVVLSEFASDRWMFSTIWTPNDLGHPVSGNREFGFFPSVAGEFVFYTRGADRCTSFIDELAAEKVFAGADLTWRSFQAKVAAFVNGNGGLATIEPRLANRYDWATVQASYSNPSIAWVV